VPRRISYAVHESLSIDSQYNGAKEQGWSEDEGQRKVDEGRYGKREEHTAGGIRCGVAELTFHIEPGAYFGELNVIMRCL
jgi:hypothetical protein